MKRSTLPWVWGRYGRVRFVTSLDRLDCLGVDVGDIGDPTHVVDHDLEVIVAVGQAGPVADADRATEEAMTATRRNPAELLVVLMDERPRMVVDVADRDARRPVAVAARDVFKAQSEFGHNVEVVSFDFADPATFGAFDGAERMFLLRPPTIADVDGVIVPALEADAARGVRHVVFLSIQGAQRNRIVPHRKMEDRLRTFGLAWTFVRAAYFIQNLSTTRAPEIRELDEIRVPAASRPSVIDVLCVAGYGITRFGWGMQTHRAAVRQVIGRRRQCALAWAERRGRGAAGRRVPSTGARRRPRPAGVR